MYFMKIHLQVTTYMRHKKRKHIPYYVYQIFLNTIVILYRQAFYFPYVFINFLNASRISYDL